MGERVTDVLADLRPLLGAALSRRGARLRMRAETNGAADVHLLGPLRTLLLALARYVPAGGEMRVRAEDRAGGDVEVVVEGVRLPEDFPRSSPERDLWALATSLLVEFHRARVAGGDERVLLLLPADFRARHLRSRDPA